MISEALQQFADKNENLIGLLYNIIVDVSIISIKFYAYLMLLAVVYYTLARKFKLQWTVLMLASLFFYLANGRQAAFWTFLPLTVTYLAARASTGLNGSRKSLLTFAVVTFNVLFLIYFKESNFFIHIVNSIFMHSGHPLLEEVSRKAPFGISYITLMLISYYLDISWGITEQQKNPFKFLACIIFFPITSSGPVVRYAQIKSTLFETHNFDYEHFCLGCQRILWGFFKKYLIANRIAIIVNNIYADESATGIIVLAGLLLVAMQIYFDFSACMDMVLGAGELFGISLPENFKQPFYATNLSEFWRRWHITLGLWVKDYVLYPILKSRSIQLLSEFLKKKLGKKNRYAKLIPTWTGTFIMWFIVGFWHGGEWNFIFGSGLFFFFMICGGQLLSPLFGKLTAAFRINTDCSAWKCFQTVRTAFLFAASVSFDRTDFRNGFRMWHRAFTDFFNFSAATYMKGFELKDIIILLVLIPFVFLLEAREFKTDDNTVWLKAIAKKNIIVRWAVYSALIYATILLGSYASGFNAADFIYMGF